jgi:SAM-dependent methyltransferase
MPKETCTVTKEWESTQYDEVYASGGADKIYDIHYRRSGYFLLFKEVARTSRAHAATSVFEVGCGTGGFAHLLLDRGDVAYRGFDFSRVAVDRAKSRTGRPDLFFVGDARLAETDTGEFDSIASTEVLEHIEDDLEVIKNWRPGVFCVCSVPKLRRRKPCTRFWLKAASTKPLRVVD